MPKTNPLAALFGRSSAGEDEGADDNALATGAQLGAQVTKLESQRDAAVSRADAAEARAKEAEEGRDASLTALREEAKRWAVTAYGAGTELTTAEIACIDAATTPAQLSGMLQRYRAATPESLRNATGQRNTEQQGSDQPAGADADRKARIEAARLEGQEAAKRRQGQIAQSGRGGKR